MQTRREDCSAAASRAVPFIQEGEFTFGTKRETRAREASTTRENKADSDRNEKKGISEDDDLRLEIPAELLQSWFDSQVEQRVGTAKEHDAVLAGRRESGSHEVEVDPPARVL